MTSPGRRLRVVALPGDGIGPEVLGPAVEVLRLAVARGGCQLELTSALLGGAAYDATGSPFPEETRAACLAADAVLLGAVGGPRYDAAPPALRPEQGLLGLRKTLGVYANLRPVKPLPSLLDATPLKRAVLEGTDLVVVRELIGGLYFGEPRGIDEAAERAVNTMVYTAGEIRRVARKAFELARTRRGHVTSVDKANVLEVSRYWRRLVTELRDAEFPDVRLDHQYVDSCAMDLIRKPASFDVLVTENLFGDILTDEASMLAGSIGLLASASLGDGPGLYEPIHGSAPDIAGRGIANPVGAIASVAMMLHSSLGLPAEAQAVERALERTLEAGVRTADLGGTTSTQAMGERICRAMESG